MSQLQLIIRGYPEGPSIFNELIQNADDAGGRCMQFVLDERTLLSDNLKDPSFSQLLGPALLAINDSQFSEADFENIQRIGCGSKAGDPSKLGRFGLGFNSAYNITEIPAFISSGKLALFDPTSSLLSESKGGWLWDTDDVSTPLLDAFSVGEAAGVQLSSRTVFRFPLRTPQQAERGRAIRNTPTCM